MSAFTNENQTRFPDEGSITVIGAGIAGLSCAIALARAGRHVVVREAHRHVGARFHGDYQGLENWSDARDVLDEVTDAGVEVTFKHSAVSKGTIYDSGGNRYDVASAQPLFYLVRRGSEDGCLDHALANQALAAGVDLRFGDRSSDVEGPAVLAIGPRRADAVAVGYVFETYLPDGAWLILDNRLAPLGYAYLLINCGRGTVATCLFTGFKRQQEFLDRTVAAFRERVGLNMRNPRPFGGYTNFRLPRTAMQGGHPVIGEQAGFQDALAGFGMRYALRSGNLAAKSIIEGTDYMHLWRRDIWPLLQAGAVNRFLFNMLGEPGWRMAARRLSQGDTRSKLRQFYRPSMVSRLLFPVARLRYRAPLRDLSCDHVNCHCVWCECQGEPDGATPV